ncbi:MAG TPA: BamA/TamA family outer membrane protein [Bryobacteraceae bacterium]|nr:BamA/TamA family outer membrane protein [Bryobacteraceae bacterium]
MNKQYGLLMCGFLLLGSPVAGQQTRVGTIESERDKKAAKLEPDAPSKVEERLIYIKDAKVLERLTAGVAGFRIKLGGLGTGGGFGLGPQYLRDDLARGTMFVDASAQASTRQWLRLEAATGQPKVANGRLFWEARALHHNYNSLPFYGQGPDSEKIRRTNYRLENTVADGMVGVHLNRFVRAGFSSGYMWNNVGPGEDDRYASSEVVFRPAQAAGIDKQTDFFRWGAFAQLDFRDSKTGPRQGGNYSVRYDSYNDRDQKLHGFQRVDMEGQQYLPLFNKRRVIVLRGRAVMTKHDEDQSVPFYLQSVLGGSQDLRGFRPYRFYDENMLVMNAEYRWEVFSGMDMGIFADAGKVARRRSDLDFKNLESAVGFGMRFNARNATFIRIDVGFSHEGFQVWFKFNDVFAQRPFGSSAPSHIF